MIEAIIFDVMGVVLIEGNDTVNLLYPYMKERNPEVELQQVIDAYIEAAEGRMTAAQLWQTCGFTQDTAALDHHYLDTCLTLDEQFLQTARLLRERGLRLALLSNDVGSWSAFMRGKFHIDALVETSVISGDVGLRKPDPAIYQIALDRLGLSPEQCAFVDDRPVNLEAAARLGLFPILYNRDGHRWQGAQITNLAQLPDLL